MPAPASPSSARLTESPMRPPRGRGSMGPMCTGNSRAASGWPSPTRWLLATLVAGPCGAPALAAGVSDEDDLAQAYGTRPLITIATGAPQSLRRAPAVATVITADDITAMGAVDLDDVLETVPGLHVGRSANRYQPLYVMRGIYSLFTPQMLVLQDGLPTAVLLQGNRLMTALLNPVQHIARVEVLRGPGSALHGADAYSGVINIVTKNSAEMAGTRAGLRRASFDTTQAWPQHGGTLGPADVSAWFSVTDTAGFRRLVEADAQTRNDAAFGTHASLAPGPLDVSGRAIDGGLAVGLGAWQFRFTVRQLKDLGAGAGIASALDPVGRAATDRAVATLGWSQPQVGNDWSLSAHLSLMHYVQRIPVPLQLFPPGTRFPTGSFAEGMLGAPETWERQTRLGAVATYRGFARQLWRIGLGHEDLDMYRTREFKNFSFAPNGVPSPAGPLADHSGIDPFMLPHRRRLDYATVQDEWQFANDWTLTAGARHDRYSDVGGTTNPRLALVWNATPELTAKLLYGTAFRPPNYTESYGINNPVANGNPALLPEKMRSGELGLAWHPANTLELGLNLFRFRMRDVIRTVPNPLPGSGATYQNIGRQEGRGFEAEATWEPSPLRRVLAHHAQQRSIDLGTGLDAGNAPHQQSYLRTEWRFAAGWATHAAVNRIADTRRVPGDSRPPVPNYTTLDLGLRSTPRRSGYDFSLLLQNATNADVREPSLAPGLVRNDLPMAPRSLSLQASCSL